MPSGDKPEKARGKPARGAMLQACHDKPSAIGEEEQRAMRARGASPTSLEIFEAMLNASKDRLRSASPKKRRSQRYEDRNPKAKRRASSAKCPGSSVKRRGSPVNRRASLVNRRGSSLNRRGSSLNRRGSSLQRHDSFVNRRGSWMKRGSSDNRHDSSVNRHDSSVKRTKSETGPPTRAAERGGDVPTHTASGGIRQELKRIKEAESRGDSEGLDCGDSDEEPGSQHATPADQPRAMFSGHTTLGTATVVGHDLHDHSKTTHNHFHLPHQPTSTEEPVSQRNAVFGGNTKIDAATSTVAGNDVYQDNSTTIHNHYPTQSAVESSPAAPPPEEHLRQPDHVRTLSGTLMVRLEAVKQGQTVVTSIVDAKFHADSSATSRKKDCGCC